jgi:hypothetical protein
MAFFNYFLDGFRARFTLLSPPKSLVVSLRPDGDEIERAEWDEGWERAEGILAPEEEKRWELLRYHSAHHSDKLPLYLVSYGQYGKIPAIKLVRRFHGIGLKEAKDLVEAATLPEEPILLGYFSETKVYALIREHIGAKDVVLQTVDVLEQMSEP